MKPARSRTTTLLPRTTTLLPRLRLKTLCPARSQRSEHSKRVCPRRASARYQHPNPGLNVKTRPYPIARGIATSPNLRNRLTSLGVTPILLWHRIPKGGGASNTITRRSPAALQPSLTSMFAQIHTSTTQAHPRGTTSHLRSWTTAKSLIKHLRGQSHSLFMSWLTR